MGDTEQEHDRLRLPTLGQMWRQGAAKLREAGAEEADADAELLLLHLLGIGKTELLRDLREPAALAADGLDRWERLLARRAAGEPVQYVTGEQFFYGRRFEVGPGVLIPRPETELLAEAVLEAGGRSSLTVLDVGTGSGILAVTLAAERPEWRVLASDLSEDALSRASSNAETHGVSARVAFYQGDLLEPFMSGPVVDVLVSNPPYIPSGDVPGLQREVKDHEPRLALDGGEDGLNPYRAMSSQLGRLPRLPRLVAWEVGAGQADDVAELLRAAAEWDSVRFVVDYAGIKRHVIAERYG
ncbi:peptide chain release factor N(5)-glutamine methyltransferase [Cohnella faecalis]|uniref:Release factor glutamine methyltransferase n=2 Tax=Cohnella faecalis TaxID=2315694 RepID=A0A398CI09_9BACL|nr:peptide chain release factor N(5)-glutamine methyltransferase [Cohnella faecalis]RIE01975.1 peptide chain release factor N(5)-glutamine methyltransferase [Cohnella faecalis]